MHRWSDNADELEEATMDIVHAFWSDDDDLDFSVRTTNPHSIRQKSERGTRLRHEMMTTYNAATQVSLCWTCSDQGAGSSFTNLA